MRVPGIKLGSPRWGLHATDASPAARRLGAHKAASRERLIMAETASSPPRRKQSLGSESACWHRAALWRIVGLPQLDGSPPWNPTSTQCIASRGTSSRTSGHYAFAFRWKVVCKSSHFSTWESTASCAAAISSVSRCGMCATAIKWRLAVTASTLRKNCGTEYRLARIYQQTALDEARRLTREKFVGDLELKVRVAHDTLVRAFRRPSRRAILSEMERLGSKPVSRHDMLLVIGLCKRASNSGNSQKR